MMPDQDLPDAKAVRCWRVIVAELDGTTRRRLFDLMDAAEQARALRFVNDSDRLSYTALHGGLETGSQGALGRGPREFSLRQGPYGKPALFDHGSVQFNMSHSGGIVLIALANGVSDRRRCRVDLLHSKNAPTLSAATFIRPEAADLAGPSPS